VELEQHLGAIRKQGLGVAAISYDSVGALKSFADRQHITYPLLSDPDSKIIRTYDILNEAVKPGTPTYGIPYPGSMSSMRRGGLCPNTLKMTTGSACLPLRFWPGGSELQWMLCEEK
jgi:AhpC/TSA family